MHLGAGFGHPGGVAASGGDPSKSTVAGVSLFERDDGVVFWANDSVSLPRRLSPAEVQSIQWGLEIHYGERPVVQLTRVADVPKGSADAPA